MAFTTSVLVNGVAFGNQLTKVIKVTADQATGTVDTGMRNVVAVMVTTASGVSGCNVMQNQNASGVASAGIIGMSACSNGNGYTLIAYGY